MRAGGLPRRIERVNSETHSSSQHHPLWVSVMGDAKVTHQSPALDAPGLGTTHNSRTQHRLPFWAL